jgi:hypothetical protein
MGVELTVNDIANLEWHAVERIRSVRQQMRLDSAPVNRYIRRRQQHRVLHQSEQQWICVVVVVVFFLKKKKKKKKKSKQARYVSHHPSQLAYA